MIYLPPHRAVHDPLPNRSRHARRRQARDNSATVADRVVRGLTCHSLRLRPTTTTTSLSGHFGFSV